MLTLPGHERGRESVAVQRQEVPTSAPSQASCDASQKALEDSFEVGEELKTENFRHRGKSHRGRVFHVREGTEVAWESRCSSTAEAKSEFNVRERHLEAGNICLRGPSSHAPWRQDHREARSIPEKGFSTRSQLQTGAENGCFQGWQGGQEADLIQSQSPSCRGSSCSSLSYV